jgi:hypothetical protein
MLASQRYEVREYGFADQALALWERAGLTHWENEHYTHPGSGAGSGLRNVGAAGTSACRVTGLQAAQAESALEGVAVGQECRPDADLVVRVGVDAEKSSIGQVVVDLLQRSVSPVES